MRQVTERQMPAGGPAFADGFALAGEVEIVEDFKMNNSNPIISGQAAKLAYVDAVLASVTISSGYRRMSRAEVAGERWENSWPEQIVHLAKFSGVDAIQANGGAFLVDQHVQVCHMDDLGRGLEEGWSCIRLPSIDGRAREKDLRAPSVLVSPNADCFLWMPRGPYGGSLGDQRRLTYFELLDELAEMGFRLARFKKAAA